MPVNLHRLATGKMALLIAALSFFAAGCGGTGEADDTITSTQDVQAGIADAGANEALVFQPGSNAFESWSLSAGAIVEDAAATAPDGSVSADRLTLPPGGTAGWVRSDMPISAGDWINGRIWLWAETDTEIVLQLVRWCSDTEAEVGTLAVVATPEPRSYSIWHQFQHAHDCVRFQIAAGSTQIDAFAWNASLNQTIDGPSAEEIEALLRDANAASAASQDADAMPQELAVAALDWYARNGVDFESISRMPVDERARRLTQAVYAHCTQGQQSVTDNNELFTECVTACAGFSYVLRGLLDVTGAETRYVKLYNIPNQGNHTAVEVFVDGRWAFFDPTFGAFFTDNGDPDGPALELSQIVTDFTAEELVGRVNQARNQQEDIVSESLQELYSEVFDHPYMSLINYQIAEAQSRLDPRELLILDIPLTIQNGEAGIGDFEAQNLGEAQAAWLRQTNEILVDADLGNDVSFLSHILSNTPNDRLTTLSIANVEPGRSYTLTLMMFGNEGDQIQIMPMGRTASYSGENVSSLDQGRTVQTSRFIATEELAQFAIRNISDDGVVGLLGIAVQAADAPSSEAG